MNPQRWKEIDELLQSVLDRLPEEREAFLRQACAGDKALEREVRSLLRSKQQAGSFLESPAIEVAACAETTACRTGQTLAHYRIVEELGRGGMGVVWKARDTRLDRFVALKLLPAADMSDPARKQRFVQEARTASALNHPNIVTIHEIGQAEIDGQSADFIAMEFVPGKALDQLLRGKQLQLGEALTYAIQVADALAAAHAAGIVHRDVKPGNLVVGENGLVKVVDFGLAKLTEQSGAVDLARSRTLTEPPTTGVGMIVGTVAYMSPEQAAGKRVDARTDIFSFGAVLYEIVTGRRAFAGDSMLSVLSAVLREEPKPAAELAPEVPRSLQRIIARCLEKDPDRRYQHAGDLKIDLQQVKEDLAARVFTSREQQWLTLNVGRRWWLPAVAACVALFLASGWWPHGPQPLPASWRLSRLTADAGLSGSPALSPDGKLVAYSADHGLDGPQDLYVKQVAGGQPIRLTSDGVGNTTPDFSPDGSKIVFRSDRDGGGIYEIPAFGGDARLIARDGLNPKYSPDGSQVAYWVGPRQGVNPASPGTGTVWMIPAAGGPPRQVGSNLTAARWPIWCPDGKHLLLLGYTSAKAGDSSSLDWWLVATEGGEAVKTGVFNKLVQFRNWADVPQTLYGPRPGCWPPGGTTAVYSFLSGDTANLWEIGLSPRTSKVSGAPTRLTTAAGTEVDPSCAPGGTLAFTNAETRTDLWSLPFDLDRGTSQGRLERVTTGPAWRYRASLANDGRHVAFTSRQSGPANIWVRDLATGREMAVAASSASQQFPVSNPSGDRIAFSVFEEGKRILYVSAPGGAPEKVCEDCPQASGWSRDEKTLLVFGGGPYQIDVIDLATHRRTPLLKHPKYHVLYGRFSPDNRWVSFTVRTQPNRAHIAIAPIDGPKPIAESAWITIGEVASADWADWSPDGKTLYFPSARDGHSCLWGQRLDANSHWPLGEPVAVQHFHGRLSYRQGGWSAAGGRIAIVLTEETGNIWMMSRADAR